MKIGKLTSLVDGPERDVLVRISSLELFSGISDPPGTIDGHEVVGCDVVGERRWFRSPIYRLYIRLKGGRRVLFYSAKEQLDVALLLDEFQASFRDAQCTWDKA
ncbi:hypothetical protein [Opitutus sp. ER46]|uniref:hypothetical protein n=1 Tax=Opitutus sp. ER46 TaxID=2161864 RepID=UPI000D2F5DEE|nr:hypothetical protein [Opitutus sp. ER46]PTX90953.1 hypothetical protein DB354_20090 [Opitutus sp. ER46]